MKLVTSARPAATTPRTDKKQLSATSKLPCLSFYLGNNIDAKSLSSVHHPLFRMKNRHN